MRGEIEPHFFKVDADIGIVLLIEDDAQRRRNKLPDDGGVGGTPHAHGGQSQQAEDQDGVKDDIEDGADPLDIHGDEGLASALKHPLGGDFHKDADRTDADDGEILGAVFRNDGGNALLHREKQPGTEQPEQRKHHAAADSQQQPDIGDGLGALAVFFAQTAGKQGVHAYAGAGGKGDHEVLDGEDKRNGGEGVFADAGDKDAVYNIIQCLNEHGDDERQRHIEDELFDRHRTHFVFLRDGLGGHRNLR